VLFICTAGLCVRYSTAPQHQTSREERDRRGGDAKKFLKIVREERRRVMHSRTRERGG